MNGFRNAPSWKVLEELVRNVDPTLRVDQKYGFYSSHTVCLPTFLPKVSVDTAWLYSLMMILLNFFAFFFAAIGYIITFTYVDKF